MSKKIILEQQRKAQEGTKEAAVPAKAAEPSAH